MISDLGKWFKKYFIPHSHNGHKPHLLRNRASSAILSVVVFLEIIFLAQTYLIFRKTDFLASVVPDTLINLTNGSRKAENLAELSVDPLLAQAAQLKAEDMARKGYFSHNSPEGVTPWDWFGQVGYEYSYAGENLAVNFYDTHDLNNAWMDSPAHRANIMNKYFTQIGIGTAKGTYEGEEAIFVVELFGRPSVRQANVAPVIVTGAKRDGNLPMEKPKTGISSNPSEKPDASRPVVENNTNGAGEPEAGGESKGPMDQEEKLFIAVNEKGEALAVETSGGGSAKQSVLGEILSIKNARQLLAMPRFTVNSILNILWAIILVAFVLNVVIKIKIQHPELIINGVFLLAFISVIVFLNSYLDVFNSKIY